MTTPDNFKNVIMQNIDVLIIFYTPSVVHIEILLELICRPSSETVIEDIKQEFLCIRKFNTAKYRVPGVEIYHIPTVKLYPARKKNLPVEYFGRKDDADSYKCFIREEGQRELKGLGSKKPSRQGTEISIRTH